MKVEIIFKELLNTIRKDNYKGIDHYDIKALPLFLYLQSFKLTNYISVILTENFNSFFKIFAKKKYNSKGLALIILALSNTVNKKNKDKRLKEINHLVNLLIEDNPNVRGFGYPFKWNTGEKILPENTPSIVVSSFVGFALIEAYKLTKDKKYLGLIENIAKFVTKDLNKHEDKRGVCFSYTPNDKKRVINANYLGARFLYDYSKYDKKYLEIANKIFDFCNSCQNKDGSWNYDDPKYKKNALIDNYHTAFNLISLQGIKKYEDIFEKGLGYYEENLFENNWPLFSTRNKLPIDIHSFAASIILFSKVNKNKAKSLLRKVFKEMYDKNKKYFYFRIYRLDEIKNSANSNVYKVYNKIHIFKKDKTKFMRWSQSWMIWALSEFLVNKYD